MAVKHMHAVLELSRSADTELSGKGWNCDDVGIPYDMWIVIWECKNKEWCVVWRVITVIGVQCQNVFI